MRLTFRLVCTRVSCIRSRKGESGIPTAKLTEQTLRRIPLYRQILLDLEVQGKDFVSSAYLANFFMIDDTQVRKDVSAIGYAGKPKSGYNTTGLRQAIEVFLGMNYENTAILIGAGKLGSALVEYPGLSEYGIKLVGVFDSDPDKVGKLVGDFSVLPVESLPRVTRSYDIGIAILTIPKSVAQEVADMIVELGIRAIWNFAPTQIAVPENVIIRNENMAVGLAMLSHYLKVHNLTKSPLGERKPG